MDSAAAVVEQRQTIDEHGSRFAKHRKSHLVEHSVFSTGPVHEHSQQELGFSIFQYIGTSLEGGPRGIHPPTHIAALSAIAGYAARLVISLKAARGETDDDFRRVSVNRTTTVIVSEQVNSMVLAMDNPSIAGVILGAALRCGLRQVPDMNVLLQKHLSESDATNSVPSDHASDVPPETLLMMYWEQVARFFRGNSDDFTFAPMAAAYAIGEAISVYRDTVPVDQSLHIALNTTIAMSKIDRTF